MFKLAIVISIMTVHSRDLTHSAADPTLNDVTQHCMTSITRHMTKPVAQNLTVSCREELYKISYLVIKRVRLG